MNWLEKNQYALVGALVGLLIAVPILTLGFFKTILLLLFIVLGIVVGRQFQDTGILEKYIAKLKQLKK